MRAILSRDVNKAVLVEIINVDITSSYGTFVVEVNKRVAYSANTAAVRIFRVRTTKNI